MDHAAAAPSFVSPEHVAGVLGMTPRTIRNYCELRILPALQAMPGSPWRILPGWEKALGLATEATTTERLKAHRQRKVERSKRRSGAAPTEQAA